MHWPKYTVLFAVVDTCTQAGCSACGGGTTGLGLMWVGVGMIAYAVLAAAFVGFLHLMERTRERNDARIRSRSATLEVMRSRARLEATMRRGTYALAHRQSCPARFCRRCYSMLMHFAHCSEGVGLVDVSHCDECDCGHDAGETVPS